MYTLALIGAVYLGFISIPAAIVLYVTTIALVTWITK